MNNQSQKLDGFWIMLIRITQFIRSGHFLQQAICYFHRRFLQTNDGNVIVDMYVNFYLWAVDQIETLRK